MLMKRSFEVNSEFIARNLRGEPTPVAARSKASVCGRSLTGIVGSNPAYGMDVCLLCVVR